ncbi:MAG: VWA domain-containing protein [Acidobacteriota bacterium]|nr:VWA domain-containing protein [Acidobacteriota bacterium]
MPDLTGFAGLQLLHPWALAIVPASLLLLVVRWAWRRRRFVSFPTAHLLPGRAYQPSALRRLPLAFALSALAATAVALGEPVVPHSTGELRSLGIDIVLVLDLSSSMNTEMAGSGSSSPDGPRGPTRLDRTRAALRAFINSRHGDRLGMVVFSNYAYVVSPLTLEREYLLRYLDIVDGQILRNEAMTAIGDGIDMAAFLLNRQAPDTRRGKVIVVFTDGERNYGRDPLESLAEAAASNIRVHLVGVDLDEQIKDRPTVQALIAAVRRNGGRYYEADTVRQLRTAYTELDTLEKSVVVSQVHVTNEPVYHWFALAAIACLGVALAFNAIPFFNEMT